MGKIFTVEVSDRAEWRDWLRHHHTSVTEVWLVFPKRATGRTTLTYDDAVEEALCYGWIDSLIRRLDDERYARKFTPRKPDSRWSTINRRRYESLLERGLLEPPGLARPPTERSGDAPFPPGSRLPEYIEKAIRDDPGAWENFQRLAPSYRRQYVVWIDSARRAATRDKRLREAIGMLTHGYKPGLK